MCRQYDLARFFSELYSPTSGVSQSSNLGPLLFLLFINGIVEDISSEKLLFADDLKLFMEINTTEDCRIIQANVNTVVDWYNSNCLLLTETEMCCSFVFYKRGTCYILQLPNGLSSLRCD